MLDKIYALKQTKRAGWLQSGIIPAEGESVADHSFFVALLALLIAPAEGEHINREKAIRMALLHDLAESVIGDITPEDAVSPDEKFSLEKSTLQDLLGDFPDGRDLFELWLEFEQGNSPEAVFVRRLDKLEMVLQAARYEKSTGINLAHFFTGVSELFHQGELTPALYQLLLQSRKPAQE
ncbi:MAG: HD domain-containing protein [Lentisphaeria bacterium]|nr:HD domain-containing protein [Candidatus Neomarinimicrobiota bacterium]MCF7841760.1 HD domain-containing protein [Lentisphaeria bacterium]